MEKIKFELIEKNDRFKVLRAKPNAGAVMPAHLADKDGFLLIDEGEIEFVLDDEMTLMKGEDSVKIPAGVVHHLKATTSCKVLLVLDTQVKIKFVDS